MTTLFDKTLSGNVKVFASLVFRVGDKTFHCDKITFKLKILPKNLPFIGNGSPCSFDASCIS